MDFNPPDLIVFFGTVFVIILIISLATVSSKRKKEIIEAVRENEKLTKEITDLENKYDGIDDLQQKIFEINREIDKRIQMNHTIKEDYNGNLKIYETLKKKIKEMEGDIQVSDFGIYKPHFDYDTSEKYKEEIKALKEKQKKAITDNQAIFCDIQWTVGGSKVEGRKMTERYEKLMLRAFNGECDATILKTRWNNATKMEERIKKAFKAVNKMGESHSITIRESYLNMKLDELRLTYEYTQKKHEEKEEQKEIKAQMREEQRALREAEKAREAAEKEELRSQKALEKAKLELSQAHGEKLERLKAQMAMLEDELEEARKQKERAISQAQITKRGHVYVISNIGSFGKNIYKIGLTRRLEPMDRVRELGDASVPFPFDVHAMIYSTNAPDLEKALHREFNDRSVNLVNMRKEFFNVSLDEIEEAVHRNFGEIEFTKIAEAQQYYESIAIRENRDVSETVEEEEELFPATL